MRTNILTDKTLRLLLIALLFVPFGLTNMAQAQQCTRENSSAIRPAGTTVPGYGVSTTSSAYQAGLADGAADRARNLPFDPYNNRWRSSQERRNYEAGYARSNNEGYPYANSPRYSRAVIEIGCDNRVMWQAPGPSFVSVQVDNQPPRLFAEGQSGAQFASWLSPGHVYVFTVEDLNGNELARDRLDLR